MRKRTLLFVGVLVVAVVVMMSVLLRDPRKRQLAQFEAKMVSEFGFAPRTPARQDKQNHKRFYVVEDIPHGTLDKITDSVQREFPDCQVLKSDKRINILFQGHKSGGGRAIEIVRVEPIVGSPFARLSIAEQLPMNLVMIIRMKLGKSVV